MSETRRYERQVKPGMQFTDGDRTISATGKDDDYLHYVIPGQSGNGSMSLELFWSNFHPVRPTTPEGWALFLPDDPLPDTGQKDFKPGQVWAVPDCTRSITFAARSISAASRSESSITSWARRSPISRTSRAFSRSSAAVIGFAAVTERRMRVSAVDRQAQLRAGRNPPLREVTAP